MKEPLRYETAAVLLILVKLHSSSFFYLLIALYSL